MNRHVVAGLLGPALALSLAGCLNDRAAVSPARPTMPPVDSSGTLPPIHQAINKENPLIDPDSMRAGHPSEPVNRSRPPYVAASRGPEAVPTPPTADGRPTLADPSTPDLPAGRPAPFAGTAPGGPRPRAGDPPVSTAADEPAAVTPDVPGAAAVPAAAAARPALDPPAPDTIPSPLPEPAAPPAEAAGPPSEPLSPAEAPPAIGSTPDDRVQPSELPAPAPTPEPSVPAAEPAPAPSSAESSPAPVRDPLLGANPDVMPPMDRLPSADGPSPKAAEAAPVELPATSDPAAVQAESPSPAASYSPPSDAGLPPPIGQMDKNVRPGGTPEASSAPKGPVPGPAADPDPLLGANPDVMPALAPPAAKDATEPSIRPEAGEPPPILEMEKAPLPAAPETSARPPADPAPAAVAPPADPTAVAAGLSNPPAPTSDVPQQAVPPAGVSRPATVVRPGGGGVEADRPRVIEVGPKPVPPAAPVERDPLLGANPDIMPAMDQIPKAPVRRPASAPSTPSALAPDPTGVPPLTVPPAPTEPPALPAPAEPPAAAQPAAPAEGPVDLPPLGDPQASTGTGRGREGFASVPVSAPPAGTRDAAARPASNSTSAAAAPPAAEPTAVRSQVSTRKVFTIGMPAARIGDDVITLYELKAAYVKRLDSMGMRGQKIPEASSRALLQSVLNDLIDRSVVLQEARRELKDVKKYKSIMDVADKYWSEEELPPLLRKTASANIYELKQKMTERGESLDEHREQFRLEFLSKGYLEQKLGPRMKVELPEMHEYYLAHLKDFDRPAQITWREVVVEVEKSKNRTEARAKVDALLARLRRGEDFAALAKSASDGPSKSDGGLWQTSPGSYAVPAVNTALESLPVGQISPVLEGPTSFHIVRVEGRRRAGPATFAEVQDKIKRVIRQEKILKESTAYLDKLRSQTVIWTAFDDPNAPRSTGRRTIPARR